MSGLFNEFIRVGNRFVSIRDIHGFIIRRDEVCIQGTDHGNIDTFSRDAVGEATFNNLVKFLSNETNFSRLVIRVVDMNVETQSPPVESGEKNF